MRTMLCVLALSCLPSMVPTVARADAESDCMGDALRLCSAAIPDRSKIEDCMTEKRASLSPSCARHFQDDPPPQGRARRRTSE